MYESDRPAEASEKAPSSQLAPRGKGPAAVPEGTFLADPALSVHDEAADLEKRPSLSAAFRHKWTLLAVFLLVAVPAITMNWALRVPQYEAGGEVRVRPIDPLMGRSRSGDPPGRRVVDTEALIIQSEAVLRRVLDQEHIQQTEWYKHPRKPLLRQLGTPMERLKEALSVETKRGTEVIRIFVKDRDPNDATRLAIEVMDQYLRYSSETDDRDATGRIHLLTEEYKALETEIAGREKVLAQLRRDLGTGDPDALVENKRIRIDKLEARINGVTAEISVLQLHKTILVKAIISMRQMERLGYRRGVAGMSDSAKRNLRSQLKERRELLEAEIAEAKGLLARLGPAGTDPDKQDLETERERDEAAASIKIRERRLAEIRWQEQELAKLMSRSPEDKQKLPAGPPPVRQEYSTDPEWRQLEAAVRSAQFKVEQGKKRWGDSYSKMVEAVGQLELAEKQLEIREMQLARQWQGGPGPLQEKETTEPDYESELESVELQLALRNHHRTVLLAQVKKERTEFDEIFNAAQLLDKETRALDHKRHLFERVRARLDEEEMWRKVPVSVEILSQPSVPSKPSRDRRATDTIAMLAIALGMAVGAAYLRASRSHAVHGAEDLPSPLRTPFLGQVPLIRKTEHLALEEDPLVAESIRMVRTALFSRIDGRCCAVLISSADTGTGKSTMATMLAKSFADCGKRVLLIDADLRRRGLSRRFGLADEPGLVQALTSRAADDTTIFKTDSPRLSVMPAGTQGDGIRIEMTANGAFTACLDRLRPKYDVILLDSSPILPVADARILSRQVDGTIMVVREDKCRRADVVDALACIGSSGGKLLGTVFIGSRGRENYQREYYYSRAES